MQLVVLVHLRFQLYRLSYYPKPRVKFFLLPYIKLTIIIPAYVFFSFTLSLLNLKENGQSSAFYIIIIISASKSL